MPASWEEVSTELHRLNKQEDVFAIVKAPAAKPRTFWSKPGQSNYHGHAEYFLCDELERYQPEQGEIVEIDITLKWSPCGWCAMRLASLKQMLASGQRQSSADIRVYYLAEFFDHSGIDPWTTLRDAQIPCSPYADTVQGRLWPVERPKWRGLV